MSQMVGFGPISRGVSKTLAAAAAAQEAAAAAQDTATAALAAAATAQAAADSLKAEVNLLISTAQASTETTFEADLFNAFASRSTIQ